MPPLINTAAASSQIFARRILLPELLYESVVEVGGRYSNDGEV